MQDPLWAEGQDGSRVLYSETLRSAWWMWLAAFGFVVMVAVAYGYAFGPPAGWLVGATGCFAAGVLLARSAARVRVDDQVLKVGRARLPLDRMGRVIPLDRDLSREARSTKLDPRAYLQLRPAAAATSVLVEVNDPDDPHPYWLFSTKRPQEVASALRRAVEVEGAPHEGGDRREG